MKNIHLIPTDKPSRLGYLTKKGKEVFKDLRLFDKLMPNILDSENQNIYITDNSEIKEGDWCLSKLNEVVRFGKKFTTSLYKKIILTTDQDLIKDGVQAIDDEFLEWFVKNPSCERVGIESFCKHGDNCPSQGAYDKQDLCDIGYKIIIPKEEPKTKHNG